MWDRAERVGRGDHGTVGRGRVLLRSTGARVGPRECIDLSYTHSMVDHVSNHRDVATCPSFLGPFPSAHTRPHVTDATCPSFLSPFLARRTRG
jgi:hypothetical protein